jgi:hypothetical protein
LISTSTCTNDDSRIIINAKSVTDCELTNSPTFLGICLDGADTAHPNEVLTYASEFSVTDSEIL